MSVFGDYLQGQRKKSRLTLRAFCEKAKADPGNISKIERGLMNSPQDQEILLRYANALGIEEGTDAWVEFTDTASVSRGKIPEDLLTNDNVEEALPAFFRTLRGQKPSEAELRAVIEMIRKS